MSKKLGICVTTRNNLFLLLGLAKAARRAGIHTEFFLTGEGIHMTKYPGFSDLLETAGRLGICEVSFISSGYKKEELAGVADKDFVTQIRNADMVEKCDRYLVL